MHRLRPDLIADIGAYIARHYTGDFDAPNTAKRAAGAPVSLRAARPAAKTCADEGAAPYAPAPAPSSGISPELSRLVSEVDESFQEALLRMIDERGMKDSTCYKRARVDRKLFSKIRSNPDYRPSKPTAIAFALALELSFEEAIIFLRKAGYALSPSSKFDVIVRYFIIHERYDLDELNAALYEFDQPLING